MADFSNYAEQGLRFGHTVPFEVTELTNADGSHPLLHVEHLGTANGTLLEEIIARAGAPRETEDAADFLRRLRENQDAVSKHCVRDIERVFFSDGTAATKDDIPAFVRAMPAKAFQRLLEFAYNEANFYKPAEKPQVLAEK